jgi:hypothetical protein
MSRPQFSLKTLLWLMAVVAAFLGGAIVQWKLDEPRRDWDVSRAGATIQTIYLRDGTRWHRTVRPETKTVPAYQAPRSETKE